MQVQIEKLFVLLRLQKECFAYGDFLSDNLDLRFQWLRQLPVEAVV